MTTEHLPSVYRIIQSLDLTPHGDLEWLRHRSVGDPSATPQTLLAAEDGDGQLLGFCIAAVYEGRGAIKLFAVREEARRRGVATALLDALEANLRALGLSEVLTQGAPPYFTPSVDLKHTSAVILLLRRGYTTDRTTRVDMCVDLTRADLATSAVEERLAGEGIALRRATPEEIPAVSAFAANGFSAMWRAETADAARFDPPALFVALSQGEIIGFAAYDVTGEDRFGPMGTRPDYRQRGIGEALLKMCLRSIRDRGSATAEISWAGPLAFYSRAVDARISRVYWVFQKTLSPDAPDQGLDAARAPRS